VAEDKPEPRPRSAGASHGDFTPGLAEPHKPQPFLASHAPFITRLCAGVVLAIGVLDLLGWMLDIPLLKSILPHWKPMMIITAICMMLSAVALVSSQASRLWKRGLSRLIGVVVCAMAALTLIVYAAVLFTGRDPAWVSAPARPWTAGWPSSRP